MHLNSIQSRAPSAARRNKVVGAADAVRLIHDGDTVATGGFVGIGFAEGIALAQGGPAHRITSSVNG